MYIYICNIQSASEDSGCGLFLYKIYEEYHKIYVSARCMAIFRMGWPTETPCSSFLMFLTPTVLTPSALAREFNFFFFSSYTYGLWFHICCFVTSSITYKTSSDETESIIIYSTEINLLWQLNQVWVSF